MADLNPTITINRSYMDNYSVKESINNYLIPKYFPNSVVSDRSVGFVGLTSELISNISEDAFNTQSVLLRETFVNKAEINEDIYAHAAIFQINNIFSTASSARFIIILKEEDIVKYMEKNPDTGIYEFFLDKDLHIYIEDYVYSFDYDIRIQCIRRNSKQTTKDAKYLYQVSYILPEDSDTALDNSISDINYPYLKHRQSDRGYLAIEVVARQMRREIIYETILNNSRINFPIIDINYSGKLAGFDVLYRSPRSDDFTTQLKTLIAHSQPTVVPFCYYTKVEENTLRISFNSKDLYFMPEYNSEIKVILYITDGADATFDRYTGDNVYVSWDECETYRYPSPIFMVSQTLTGSTGGTDELTMSQLQSLTTMAYRTATAITTEPDLNEYFRNYTIQHNREYIKFFKKRDDIFERVFNASLLLKDSNGLVYKTNTLDIELNLYDMVPSNDNKVFTMRPGTLFKYKGDSDTVVELIKDEERREIYLAEYNAVRLLAEEDRLNAVPPMDSTIDKDIWFVNTTNREYANDSVKYEIAPYQLWLSRKRAKRVAKEMSVVEVEIERYEKNTTSYGVYKINSVVVAEDNVQVSIVIENDVANTDNGPVPGTLSDGGEMYVVFTNKGDYISATIVHIPLSAENKEEILGNDYIAIVDMPYGTSIFHGSVHNGGSSLLYDDSRTLFTVISDNISTELGRLDNPLDNTFLFTNPFLIRFIKDPANLSLYLTFINNTHLLDYIERNDDKVFVQFTADVLTIERSFYNTSEYRISTTIKSTLKLDDIDSSPIYTLKEHGVLIDDPYPTANQPKLTYKNNLRVFAVIYDRNNQPICYTEMYPGIPTQGVLDSIPYYGSFYTDDYITSDNLLRLNPVQRFTDKRDSYKYYVLYEEHMTDTGAYYDNPQDAEFATRAHVYPYYGDATCIETVLEEGVYRIHIYEKKPIKHFWANPTGTFDVYEWDDDDEKFKLVSNYTVTGEEISELMNSKLHDTPACELVVVNENPTRGFYYEPDLDNPGRYFSYDSRGMIRRGSSIPADEIEAFTQLTESNETVNMTSNANIFIPITDARVEIVTCFNRVYDETNEKGSTLVKAIPDMNNNEFTKYDEDMKRYIWTNRYATVTNPVTFVKPLNSCRGYFEYYDWTKDKIDVFDGMMHMIPLIKWDIGLDSTENIEENQIESFLNQFFDVYTNLTSIELNQLRQATGFDLKFYNTYGRSKHFLIGEQNREINLGIVNISIEFDIFYISGTDYVEASNEVRLFVKDEVEKINDYGLNAIHISNLMRKMESQFAYIDHIIFRGFNTLATFDTGYKTRYDSTLSEEDRKERYDATTFQTIRPDKTDISELPKLQRRFYIPELLTVDYENIILNEYTVE